MHLRGNDCYNVIINISMRCDFSTLRDEFLHICIKIIIEGLAGFHLYRGGRGGGGKLPPKNFMYVNDIIQKIVSN